LYDTSSVEDIISIYSKIKTNNLNFDDPNNKKFCDFIRMHSLLISIYELYGKCMDGKLFKTITRGMVLIKLFAKDKKHNSMIFKEGLNTDPEKFDPTGFCSKGGIYFIEEKYKNDWTSYNNKKMYYASLVSIPDDAMVYVEDRKFKTDKIFVIGFIPI